MRASPGAAGRGTPVPGRDDRAHVVGPEAPEGGGPFEGGEEDLCAVGGFHLGQLVEVTLERGDPRAAAPLMKDSAAGPRAQNAFSAEVFGRTARVGIGRGPP